MRRIAVSVCTLIAVMTSFLSTFCSRETKEEEGRDWFIYDSYNEAGSYEPAESFSSGDGSIKSVVVHWRSGDITVEEGEESALSVRENASALSDEEKMHILLRDGVLYIEFCSSGYKFTRKEKNKPLKIEIPSGLSLTITASSGNISLNHFTGSDLALRTTSGSVSTGKITLNGELSLHTTSGDITVESLSSLNADISTTTGDIEIGRMECGKVSLERVTGDLRIGHFSIQDGSFTSSTGESSFSGEAGTLLVSATSGDIKAESLSVSDHLTMKTSSGDVHISSLSASSLEISSVVGLLSISSLDTESFDIGTTTGAVSLSLSSPADGSVRSSTGDISFSSLPENTVLTYKSSSGKLSYDNLLSYSEGVFSIGSGEHLISVTTSSGNLSVK